MCRPQTFSNFCPHLRFFYCNFEWFEGLARGSAVELPRLWRETTFIVHTWVVVETGFTVSLNPLRRSIIGRRTVPGRSWGEKQTGNHITELVQNNGNLIRPKLIMSRGMKFVLVLWIMDVQSCFVEPKQYVRYLVFPANNLAYLFYSYIQGSRDSTKIKKILF